MLYVHLSLCLTLCELVDHDHIGWKSWKLIARTISSSLFVAQRSSTYFQENMEKFWGENVRSTHAHIQTRPFRAAQWARYVASALWLTTCEPDLWGKTRCSFNTYIHNTYVHNVRLNWVSRESHDLRWRCGCLLFVYFCWPHHTVLFTIVQLSFTFLVLAHPGGPEQNPRGP